MSLCRYGDPMCALQGHIYPLRHDSWLLESRAQGFEETHLAGTVGSVVGDHGTSAQIPRYRCRHTVLYGHGELLPNL